MVAAVLCLAVGFLQRGAVIHTCPKENRGQQAPRPSSPKLTKCVAAGTTASVIPAPHKAGRKNVAWSPLNSGEQRVSKPVKGRPPGHLTAVAIGGRAARPRERKKRAGQSIYPPHSPHDPECTTHHRGPLNAARRRTRLGSTPTGDRNAAHTGTRRTPRRRVTTHTKLPPLGQSPAALGRPYLEPRRRHRRSHQGRHRPTACPSPPPHIRDSDATIPHAAP